MADLPAPAASWLPLVHQLSLALLLKLHLQQLLCEYDALLGRLMDPVMPHPARSAHLLNSAWLYPFFPQRSQKPFPYSSCAL